MDFLKNQRGYALLLVMLLVVLFTILGMGLLTMNLNASKQFNLKENQVEARHLSEMGILHYQNALEKKVQANTTSLQCALIEPLLQAVNTDTKSDFKYEVTGNNDSGSSCTDQKGTLQVKVKSKSEGNLKTEKTITATYYIKNKGSQTSGNIVPPTPVVPAKPVTSGSKLITWNRSCGSFGEKACKDSNEIIQEFTEVNTIVMKQNSLHFKDSLAIDKLVVQGGNGAVLKVDKNMYVNNEIDVQNHACVAVGQNLVVKQAISSKNKLYMVIYKDAYLPKILDGTSANNEMYVFGNVFLPMDFQMPAKTNKLLKVYVKGNVYKVSGTNSVTKIINPFETMTGNRTVMASQLPCATPGMEQPATNPAFSGTAFWKMEDDPLIDYK